MSRSDVLMITGMGGDAGRLAAYERPIEPELVLLPVSSWGFMDRAAGIGQFGHPNRGTVWYRGFRARFGPDITTRDGRDTRPGTR